MKFFVLFIVFFLVALMSAGCSISRKKLDAVIVEKVKEKAVSDLNCSNEKLIVTMVDNRHFGVQDCKQQVNYSAIGPLCKAEHLSDVRTVIDRYCFIVVNTNAMKTT